MFQLSFVLFRLDTNFTYLINSIQTAQKQKQKNDSVLCFIFIFIKIYKNDLSIKTVPFEPEMNASKLH